MKTLHTIAATLFALCFAISLRAANTVPVNQPVQFSGFGDGASGWEWNFGDGATVTGIADPVHVFKFPGTYTVTVTATNGVCTESFSQVIEVVSKQQSAEAEVNVGLSLSAYPNPVMDFVSLDIEAPREETYAVRIFDAAGAVVTSLTATVNGSHVVDRLPVMDLAAGVYLVEVKGKQDVFTTRFMKQ